MNKKPAPITTILATDCGSTTTKAILIEKRDGEFRLICRGEAPTTVEAPFEDVTKGVLNAIGEIGDIMGRKFIEGDQTFIRTRFGGSMKGRAYLETKMGYISGQARWL